MLNNGLGPVTAGKLLAAKRPTLIPVWDKWVDVALQPKTGKFWKSMWDLFRDDNPVEDGRSFIEQVRDIRSVAVDQAAKLALHVPSVPSDVRTLDSIVWMRVFGCKDSPEPGVQRL